MADLVGMIALLVAANLGTALVFDGWQSAVLQLVAATLAVLGARWRGYSWASLGLSGDRLTAGLRLGGVSVVVITVGVVLIAVLPFSRGFLDDDRFLDLSTAEAIYEVVFRIPVITALTEELLFRSVLLTVLLAGLSRRRAVVAGSLLFGLWHVLATLGDLGGNDVSDSFVGWEVAASVTGVVVFTAASGAIFNWLRLRSGSLMAPWMAHVFTNGSMFVAGLIVAGS
jgi:CAAX protease family protein